MNAPSQDQPSPTQLTHRQALSSLRRANCHDIKSVICECGWRYPLPFPLYHPVPRTLPGPWKASSLQSDILSPVPKSIESHGQKLGKAMPNRPCWTQASFPGCWSYLQWSPLTCDSVVTSVLVSEDSQNAQWNWLAGFWTQVLAQGSPWSCP